MNHPTNFYFCGRDSAEGYSKNVYVNGYFLTRERELRDRYQC